MAGIERRPLRDGTMSFRVIWRQDGQRQYDTFGDQYDAAAFKVDVERAGNRWPTGWVRGIGYPADLVAEAEILDQTASTRTTLLEAAIRHTESRNTKAAVEHRMKMRRNFTRHLVELGERPIDRVTREHVQDWLDDLAADGKAFKTIKNLRSDLSTVFKFAVLDSALPSVLTNPVLGTHIDAPDNGGRKPVFLRMYEFEAIAGFLSGEHHVYVHTLARTGMRKGEALALRVGDLDLTSDQPAIVIDKAVKHGHDGVHRIDRPKTNAGMRTVTIDDGLAEMLRGHVRGRAAVDLVFGGHGNDGTWQRNVWVPAINAALLPEDRRPRIHDLRHTHASWLLATGEDLFKVSRRLGHEDITTTSNIYGHLDKSGGASSAAAMGRLMAENRAQLHVV